MELGLRLSFGCQRANNLGADAHRGDGERFVVRADEKLTAFLELESAIGKQKPRRGSPARGFGGFGFLLFFCFTVSPSLIVTHGIQPECHQPGSRTGC